MTLEANDQAAELEPSQELPDLRASRVFARHDGEVRAPAQPDVLPAEDSRRQGVEREQKGGRNKARRSYARRRLFAVPVAVVLLASVAGGGYLYLDNARHFETTDDAFITARQFPIARR
jgi:membrane fusion protein (multidrug efflux system)